MQATRSWTRFVVAMLIVAIVSMVFAFTTVPYRGLSHASAAPQVRTAMDRTAVGALGFSYPASVASREWLDQNGDPYLLKTMSSWGMAQNLSNANITTALEGLKARGFNAVTVGLPGQSYGGDWARYENAAGDQYFATVAGGNTAGTPWSSELGAAWSTFDHIMDEATRLGMTVVISLYTGFGTMGCEADIISAGTTAMYDFGVALATRYANYPNVVWHIGADDNWVYNNGPGSVVDSFYDGIRDAEGSTHRLWVAEPNNGSTSYAQWTSAFTGTGGFTYFRLNANNVYDYGDNSVDQFDAVYTEPGATTYPVWDAEPPYVGAPHYGGNERQQLRERNYATFIRGGIGINYGHEDWWSFDYSDLFDAPGTNSWTEVPTEPELYDAEHAWALLDTYRSDATWAPDAGSFLKTGVGSGDTKAASGYSNTAALVYFPSSRAIVVDTTVLAGTDNVRLRWFDPTDGTYDVIVNSEAQNASRSVAYPGNNAAGQGDWVLVIDTANTAPPSTTTTTTTQPATTTTTTTQPATTTTSTTTTSTTTTTTTQPATTTTSTTTTTTSTSTTTTTTEPAPVTGTTSTTTSTSTTTTTTEPAPVTGTTTTSTAPPTTTTEPVPVTGTTTTSTEPPTTTSTTTTTQPPTTTSTTTTTTQPPTTTSTTTTTTEPPTTTSTTTTTEPPTTTSTTTTTEPAPVTGTTSTTTSTSTTTTTTEPVPDTGTTTTSTEPTTTTTTEPVPDTGTTTTTIKPPFPDSWAVDPGSSWWRWLLYLYSHMMRGWWPVRW